MKVIKNNFKIKQKEFLHILDKNKTLKISEHDFVLLNINKQKHERGVLDVASQKAHVSIFSDYLTDCMFNSRIGFYKKLLFRNYEQVKNLFFDYKTPEFLDVLYIKHTAFFANEVIRLFTVTETLLNNLIKKF